MVHFEAKTFLHFCHLHKDAFVFVLGGESVSLEQLPCTLYQTIYIRIGPIVVIKPWNLKEEKNGRK